MELQDSTKFFTVHMSHSRKELLDIIRLFKLPIAGKNDKNKKALQDAIVEVVRFLDNVEPEDEYFFIGCKEELIEYLKKTKPSKDINYQRKN